MRIKKGGHPPDVYTKYEGIGATCQNEYIYTFLCIHNIPGLLLHYIQIQYNPTMQYMYTYIICYSVL